MSALTNVDAAIKAAHIENIEKRYKTVKPEIKPWVPVMDYNAAEVKQSEQPEKSPDAPICPKCGSPLVLRTAKKGNNVGKQFYGCSAFPKCRYTQNVDSVEE